VELERELAPAESMMSVENQVRAECQRIRSDLKVLGTRITAADYGRTADVDKVHEDLTALKGQVNMLLQQVAPLQEIHETSLKSHERLNKVEARLRKLTDVTSRVPSSFHLQHAWLPIFAIMQLMLSWVILVK